MGKEYSIDELNDLSKESLVVLFLSMQDQIKQLNQNMERLIEQIAVANNSRFGRSSEKLKMMDGQLDFSDILNEAESLVATSYFPEPDMEEVYPALAPETKSPERKRDSVNRI